MLRLSSNVKVCWPQGPLRCSDVTFALFFSKGGVFGRIWKPWLVPVIYEGSLIYILFLVGIDYRFLLGPFCVNSYGIQYDGMKGLCFFW